MSTGWDDKARGRVTQIIVEGVSAASLRAALPGCQIKPVGRYVQIVVELQRGEIYRYLDPIRSLGGILIDLSIADARSGFLAGHIQVHKTAS